MAQEKNKEKNETICGKPDFDICNYIVYGSVLHYRIYPFLGRTGSFVFPGTGHFLYAYQFLSESVDVGRVPALPSGQRNHQCVFNIGVKDDNRHCASYFGVLYGSLCPDKDKYAFP